MSTNKKIHLLCTDADRAALESVLKHLQEKGLRVSEEGNVQKDDIVLAALSENLYADRDRVETLLTLIGSGAENILPLQLDEAMIPDTLKTALYARNIISAAGRDDFQIAERILSAMPQKKSRLPLILATAGVILLAVIGFVFLRPAPSVESIPVEPEVTEPAYVLPAGLTEEDLEKIVDVIIVGEQVAFYTQDDVKNGFQYPDWDYFAYRDFDNEGAHWFSREDGHEYSLTRHEDLRFLQLLPNLRYLTLARVEAGELPELGELSKLSNLMLMDSVIPDLEWVRDSSIRKIDLLNSTGSVTDFSPLTSCGKLNEVHIDLVGTEQADMSSFAPPVLSWLWINNAQDLRGNLDLSSLEACTNLTSCQLEYVPVEDLSFLRTAVKLTSLRLEGLHQLRDISVLSGMDKLHDLTVSDCDAIRDFSSVAGCTSLKSFWYRTEEPFIFRDASFLEDLPNLSDISLQNVDLPDVDFLRGIGTHQDIISLDLTGNFGDYSALETFTRYSRLNLDPGDNTPLERILPYLENATIQDLALRRFSAVDLSSLPKVTMRLELDRCGISDLSSIAENWTASRLNLNKCSVLRSLDGLQNQSRIQELEIFNCPRLTDWSALEGYSLSSLSITGGYTLPAQVHYHTGVLAIDSVADVSDLSFLDTMDTEKRCSFALVGLDGLDNLEPLRRFHGAYLAVSPQLAEQAEDLVKSGNFGEYRIEFPKGGWEQDNSEFSLLSLDELETLPPALLRRVTSVCIAGDQVVDRDRFDLNEDWEHRNSYGHPTLLLHNRETDEQTPLSKGVITNLSMLSELTGLRRLFLYGQPLETLDGIQIFSSLDEFSAQGCSLLKDASALFALPDLTGADLKFTSIDSIQGVQNLHELNWLDISNTNVNDLTPLSACDFSVAYEHGGLGLAFNELELSDEDFAALGSVQRYRTLNFTDADPAVWIPALADCDIESFGAAGDLRSNEDLAALAEAHPELRELWLGWMPGITDLSPLVAMENLERVSIQHDMKEAIASLDGQSYAFRLEITG